MPELDRGAFKGSSLERVQSKVGSVEREVVMPVFATDDQLFRRFIDAMYDAHVYAWEAFHMGSPMQVTREEWMRYAFTALRSRLARINDEGGHIRCDDEWQVPAMLASVINAIGRVTIDAPAMVYKPVWDKRFDNMVLSRTDWVRITQKLRVLASDREHTKFIFVRSISGDRSGDPMIMDLIPVRDETGRVAQLRSDQPVDGIAAFVYLACGFMPEIYGVLTLETHQRLLPRRYVDAGVAAFGADELGARSA